MRGRTVTDPGKDGRRQEEQRVALGNTRATGGRGTQVARPPRTILAGTRYHHGFAYTEWLGNPERCRLGFEVG